MKPKQRVGFTGTRQGLSSVQQQALWGVLRDLNRQYDLIGHHGDCVGADAEFHEMCRQMYVPVVMHPPITAVHRAFCAGSLVEREPKPYLDRNREIIEESDLLLVCPKEFDVQLRSGTWATYRHACKRKKSIRIVYPDGRVRAPSI